MWSDAVKFTVVVLKIRRLWQSVKRFLNKAKSEYFPSHSSHFNIQYWFNCCKGGCTLLNFEKVGSFCYPVIGNLFAWSIILYVLTGQFKGSYESPTCEPYLQYLYLLCWDIVYVSLKLYTRSTVIVLKMAMLTFSPLCWYMYSNHICC